MSDSNSEPILAPISDDIRPIWVVIITPTGDVQRDIFTLKEVNFGRKTTALGLVDRPIQIHVDLPTRPLPHKQFRITQAKGSLVIFDLKSNIGTYLNGVTVTTPRVISATDVIKVNDLMIHVGFVDTHSSSI